LRTTIPDQDETESFGESFDRFWQHDSACKRLSTGLLISRTIKKAASVAAQSLDDHSRDSGDDE
jgi:hypothetical protein